MQLSNYPCSIVIIGVGGWGGTPFDAMKALDGDDGLLKDDSGNVVKRDIVQFVAFREAMRTGTLAQQVLKEIPN